MGKEQAKIPGKKRKALVVVVWQASAHSQALVLLLKRPKNEAGYLWQPVTGNLEKGEDFAAGAEREAHEETGLAFLGPPEFLGIQHEYLGRWGAAEERAFRLQVRGAEPPDPKLDPSEHDAFAWLTPEAAIERISFPQQQEAILRATYRPVPLHLNAEGHWFQDGEEITHVRTLELLNRSLAWEPSPENAGEFEYCVRVGDAQLPVIIEDTPLFVRSVDLAAERICLNSGEWVELDPETLAIRAGNILYARVAGQSARFLRPAYYELTKRIDENPNSSGGFRILWKGKYTALNQD